MILNDDYIKPSNPWMYASSFGYPGCFTQKYAGIQPQSPPDTRTTSGLTLYSLYLNFKL